MTPTRRDLLAAAAVAAVAGPAAATAPTTCTVWLWLGGGPSALETFAADRRSVTGLSPTTVPGLAFGGTFPRLAERAKWLAVYRRFGHAAATHGRAAHLVHTGTDDPAADGHFDQVSPHFAAGRRWVRLGRTTGDDGPGSPTDEPSSHLPLAAQLRRARELTERGVEVVTLHHPGWDMHADIRGGMERLGPELDVAVAEFLDDVRNCGLWSRVRLVVTGEFGRTPTVNAHGGRDHFPEQTPLLMAGGGSPEGAMIDVPITPAGLVRMLTT